MDEKKHHHYSGPNSEEFWEKVNRFKGDTHDALYTLGVVLQNLESDVLHKLSLAEENLIEKIRRN